ncbi:MAG: YhbY family RNA-binding protein [Pseudomonadales bacterium]
MSLKNPEKKHLRTLGHDLKPIITVAGNGLNDNIMAELERALTDHELIKVSIKVADRDARAQLTDTICDQTKAVLVQAIGHTILILRRNPEPNPRLSNLLRRK